MEQRLVGELSARLRGPVLGPAGPAYDEARAVWNAMIDRRPALIARCLGSADVRAGVDFAREHGLPLSIRGGGHNIAGLAVCDGGLMLDMSLMRGVWVDPRARTARAQAGCLLGDVDRETQLHGLAAVLGFISNTGVAGLTLGGGFGYLTRRYGWTCDNVLSMDAVTADGRLVRASESENADLFWGLCGGGGNFGVVTGFEYRLHPVGPEIVGGAIAWPAERADEILDLYRRVAADAPPELACVAGVRIAPPAPWLDPKIHGKPIVALFLCHTGSLEDGERAAARLRQPGGAVGDVLQRRPYTSQQSLLDATQPRGRRYYWKSEYLPGLPPALFAAISRHAADIPSPHSAILVFPLDGALNRMPADTSPAGNRDATAIVNVAGSWESAADDAANIEWVRRGWQDLRRFSTGGTYVNFLTADEPEERLRAAYGPHLDRLVDVKTKWDPGNLFRANKNFAPRTA
jgi:FAD/FMN-containing dehydrogenase